MDVLSPAMILLALILAAVWLITAPLTKRIRAQERALSADELKTFNDTHLRQPDPTAIPSKFAELHSLKRRMSRIWIVSCVVIILALVAIIYLGTDLGLQR